MGRIQSSVGLITGTDIQGTVDQLIKISGVPRDRLVARTEGLQQEQKAIAELTATVIGVQLSAKSFGNETLFQTRKHSSSNQEALSVETEQGAATGDYSVQGRQLAGTHAVQTRIGLDARDEPLGLTGQFDIRSQGTLDHSLKLRDLNEGRGVEAGAIRISDRSGATVDVDLSAARTVGDVLARINETAGLDVRATADQDRIYLTDLSGSSASNLRVQEVGDGETAADLGLWGIDVAADQASGLDLTTPEMGPLFGTPLSELGGGEGFGGLSSLEITLRDGTSASVDLSAATTIQQVVESLNQTGLDLTARLDDSRSGLQLRDLSGGTANDFTIRSNDDTAARLGIEAASTATRIDGKNLNRQTVGRDSLLSELNQGSGLDRGSMKLTDSDGKSSAINLKVLEIETVGELLDKINGLDLAMTAELNEAGDGIQILDNGAGSQPLRISDVGEGKTAAQLGIAGDAATQTIDGQSVAALVGGERLRIDVEADDTLESIVAKINASERFVEASIVSGDEGQQTLRLRSRQGGAAGVFSIDTAGFDLGLQTIQRGQDAELTLRDDQGVERLLRSADGVFADEASGLNLTLKQLTAQPVEVSVEENPDAVVKAARTFVGQYNKLVEKLDSLTFYEPESNSTGLLFGSSEALRIETSFSRLLSGPVRGNGQIGSLAEVGFSLNETGKLSLDEAKLKKRLSEGAAAVEQFFTTEETGLADRLDRVTERVAGLDNGLLLSRSNTLTQQIESNNERIETLGTRLANERERLLKQFYSVEEAIAKVQSNQQYISQIQPMQTPV